MKTYISMLRGINVSGQKLIKMDALKKMYDSLDFKAIQTYVQSGNVIFQSEQSEHEELENKISEKIQEIFGFKVPVIVLNTDELRDVIKNNPYNADSSKDKSFLHLTFLAQKPEQIDWESINLKKAENEAFSIVDKTVYLYCPNGYAQTKLSNTYLETKLKVRATTRNWKTTRVLLQMAES